MYRVRVEANSFEDSLTDKNVTPQSDAEAPATGGIEVTLHVTSDREVASLAKGEIEVNPHVDIQVIALASTKPFVHRDGWFLGGTSDHCVLTRYVDHVTFRL